MELKVNELIIPQQPQFNYKEIKEWLTERVQMYETLVYTDAEIKQAKADKANLNKLKKALNDERIRLERIYMVPFNNFKTQVSELIQIIDKPIAIIDKQVKEYDEKKKQEKQDDIEKLWNEIVHPQWLRLDMIFNQKWLNATVSIKQVVQEIDERLDAIKKDLATLSNLSEFSFEATEVYKSTLDISMAITEGQRLVEIQKRKEELERQKQEEAERQKYENFSEYMTPPEPQLEIDEESVGQWVNFSAFLTVAQAAELKDFFNRRGIQFKAI